MFKKLKENKKGFTLVELIVVLVILAILAALLVPALTGYIDKAKRKSIVAETRQAVMAAQTLVDEEYGKAVEGAKLEFGGSNTNLTYAKVKDLAEVKGNVKAVVVGTTTGTAGAEKYSNAGVVTSLTYENGGKTCVYTKDATTGTDGAYDVQ